MPVHVQNRREDAGTVDPETGEVSALSDAREKDGRTSAVLHFGPAQSWFVLFRDRPSAPTSASDPFPSELPFQDIKGPRTLSYDPAWGTSEKVTLDKLISWSEHPDPLVKYYSGTVAYRKAFDVPKPTILTEMLRLSLDLGKVEVMARVRLNGEDCGIACCRWEP